MTAMTMNSIEEILPFTRQLLEKTVHKGETVVDATMGNGHDTLFLGDLVGDRGLVLAYDIQERAVKKTEARLREAGYKPYVHWEGVISGETCFVQQAEEETRALGITRNTYSGIHLFRKGHETASEELTTCRKENKLAAAMFNLGYLPGGDKSVITSPQTTLRCVQILADHLRVGGVITLVIYCGHPGGDKERDVLLNALSSWDARRFHVLQYAFLNKENNPPFLLAIERKQ
jgi:hypothetical protein